MTEPKALTWPPNCPHPIQLSIRAFVNPWTRESDPTSFLFRVPLIQFFFFLYRNQRKCPLLEQGTLALASLLRTRSFAHFWYTVKGWNGGPKDTLPTSWCQVPQDTPRCPLSRFPAARAVCEQWLSMTWSHVLIGLIGSASASAKLPQ